MVHPAAAISAVGAVWRMSDGTKCVSHAARVGLFPTLGFQDHYVAYGAISRRHLKCVAHDVIGCR